MTATTLEAGTVQVPVDHVNGVSQSSTYAETVITGADINAVPFDQVSYLFMASAASADMDIKIYGANDPAFACERMVKELTLSGGNATGSWSATAPLYGWYRPKMLDSASGVTGCITVYALARR